MSEQLAVDDKFIQIYEVELKFHHLARWMIVCDLLLRSWLQLLLDII